MGRSAQPRACLPKKKPRVRWTELRWRRASRSAHFLLGRCRLPDLRELRLKCLDLLCCLDFLSEFRARLCSAPPPIATPHRNTSPPPAWRFPPLAAATPPRSPSRRPTRRDVAATVVAAMPRRRDARPRRWPCPPILHRDAPARSPPRRHDAHRCDAPRIATSPRLSPPRCRDAAMLGRAAGCAATVPSHPPSRRARRAVPPQMRQQPANQASSKGSCLPCELQESSRRRLRARNPRSY